MDTKIRSVDAEFLRGRALAVEDLPSCCEAEQFDFDTTDDIEALDDIIGQDRALAAIRFGLGMTGKGYNLYVLGPPGTGKFTATNRFLRDKAVTEPAPPDWCYVNNFADGAKPQLLTLPTGRGVALSRCMRQLIEDLLTVIPGAFESNEYKARARQVEEQLEKQQQNAFRELNEAASADGIKVQQTANELSFIPLKDGEELDPKAFEELPEEEQTRLQTAVEGLRERLRNIFQQQMPQWHKAAREAFRQLNYQVTLEAVAMPFAGAHREFADLPSVLVYLNEVQKDVIANVGYFRPQEGAPEAPPGRNPLARYEVNLLLDRTGDGGAPIIHEEHPSYANLLGRIEHNAYMGALLTDFTLIKPGALHKANGGYLILDAIKLLMQPYAWEGLKRALSTRELRIEPLEQTLGLVSTLSLEPEPIPLDVKVVLLGDRYLYYLLFAQDPEFAELFKVPVDFDSAMARTPEGDFLYARMIATVVRQKGLMPFNRAAVAAIIQQSMRIEADSTKLSTHMRSVADLIAEADYWARDAGHACVGAEDVHRAVATQIERVDRVRDLVHENIQRDAVLIDTAGAVIGQVNGLSVLQLGNFSFGQPSRITCTTRLGDGRVIDIERETTMGGPIHTKGVFILSSFLGARYGQKAALSLTASLAFEQSYGGVDGDSASLAELCALLSSIGHIPIRQCLAMTGSINQLGQVQVIGGINEKIEGFFDICRERGLTGDQGVLLPRNNVPNLLPRPDVVAALTAGDFHLYPVSHIDEAIEILTGVAAGVIDSKGDYPPDTVNGKVQARLKHFADLRIASGRSASKPSEQSWRRPGQRR